MRVGSFLIIGLVAVGLTMGAASSTDTSVFYAQHNLVSDGAVPADTPTDLDLVNAWGLASSGSSPWWVADNGTNKSTLYNGNTGLKAGLVVSVPGHPTGVVFNSGSGFAVPGHNKSSFIFATEDGTIVGWSGGTAVSEFPNVPAGGVYKGLAFAHTATADFIYATNFHEGTVDVFNSSFMPVTGGFIDPTIPEGYAPFGIQNLGNTIYVTYALQDAEAHDDVPGEGHGYVNAFDIAGNFLQRAASKGELNSPWGLALAPSGFGKFSGDLLVGNFGDGRIHAFDPGDIGKKGFEARGSLRSAHGHAIEIDGLWGLAFGNGFGAGPTNTLFFTAGPFDEQHGLFGTLVAVASARHDDDDDDDR